MACQARTLPAITRVASIARPSTFTVRRSVPCGPLLSHLCMHIVTLCTLPSRTNSFLLLPRCLSCHHQTSYS